jgi:hypothetical protein
MQKPAPEPNGSGAHDPAHRKWVKVVRNPSPPWVILVRKLLPGWVMVVRNDTSRARFCLGAIPACQRRQAEHVVEFPEYKQAGVRGDAVIWEIR